MKTIFLIIVLGCLTSFTVHAQGINLGIKAGANFSSLKGDGNTGDNLTSYHIGALLELNILPSFSIQPELMYSSQGSKINDEDYKLTYISVPVLAKFYVLPNKLSFEAGPQFSFLTDDNLDDTLDKTKSFDFALAGGVGLNIINGLFAQARYVVGMTDVSSDTKAKNHVIQLSIGYRF